jgi:hypothetical protein
MKTLAAYVRVLTLLTLLCAAGTMAATVTTAGSGNWNSTAVNAPWPGGVVPASTDNVIIAGGHTVTVSANAACATLSFQAANPSAVAINPGMTLGVSGAITIPAASSSVNQIAVGDGTVNAGSVAFTSGGGASRYQITIATGTLTVAGNVTQSGTSGRAIIAFSGAGSMRVGGSFLTSTNGTLTLAAGCTVEYFASGNQTVGNFTYNNLTLSGSGTKTLTNVTVNGVLSMEGTASASTSPTYGAAATLQYNKPAAYTAGAEWVTPFAATGGVIIGNSGRITMNADKVLNSTVPLTIRSGATLASNNRDLTLGGDFHNAGSFLGGNSAITFGSGNAVQKIDGFTTTGAITIDKTGGSATFAGTVNAGSLTFASNANSITAGLETGAVMTLTGGLTIPRPPSGTYTYAFDVAGSSLSCGSITLSGTTGGSRLSVVTISTGTLSVTGGISSAGTDSRITVSGAGVINVGGSFMSGTLGAFAPGTGTVNCTGTQTVPALSYYDLTFSGTGVKTVASGTTIAVGRNWNVGSPTTLSTTANVTVAGNITGTGAITAGSGTITTNGNWTNTGTFSAGTGTVMYAGGSPQTVAPLTYNNLTINKSAGEAALSGDATVTRALNLAGGLLTTGTHQVSLGTSASITAGAGSYVNGNLRKTFAAGAQSFTFPIGDASVYAPVELAFANMTTGGSLTVFTTQGQHASIASSGIDPAKDVNRFWTLSNSGIVSSNYSARLNFAAGDVVGGANPAAFLVRRFSGGSWASTALGTVTATSIQATGLASFGDFAVGEPVAVTGIAIKTPPAKVFYTVGQTLDLTGLVVTLSTSSGTLQDVAFPNFAAYGITTVKAQGAILNAADATVVISVGGHSVNQPITVTTAIASVIVVRTSPAIGEAGADASVDPGADYTHVSTVWSGRAGATFAAGETPQAVITLAAKAGYSFIGLTAANIAVAGGTVSYATGQGVQGSGSTVIFTVAYPPLSTGRTITSTTNTGNWNSTSTWVGGIVPTSVDSVIIVSGADITVTANAACRAIKFNNPGYLSTSLSLNSAVALTVFHAVTWTQPTGTSSLALNVGAGSLSAGAIVLAGGSNRTCQITISTGTVTCSGSVTNTGTAANGQVIFSGAGTFNVGGNFTPGAFTAGTGTVNFNGTGAQTVGAYAYNNLTISNTAADPALAGAVTVSGVLALTGNLAIAANTLTLNGPQISGAGMLISTSGSSLSYGGTSTGVSIPSSVAVLANLTINKSSGVSLNGDLAIAGALTLTSGVFAVGAHILTINGTAAATGGSLSSAADGTVIWGGASAQTILPASYGMLMFTGAGAKTTPTGTITVAGDWGVNGGTALLNTRNTSMTIGGGITGTGAITSGNGTITVGGDWTQSGTFTAGSGRVTYNGSAAQILRGATYNNLTLSGTGSKNAAGPVTVTAALTNTSIFDMAASVLTLGSATTNTGGTVRFSGATNGRVIGTGTVEYYGSGQTIAAGTYANLTINLATGASASLNGATTVSGVLAFGNGTIVTGANNLVIGSSGSITGAGTGNYVSGNLQKVFGTGARIFKFEIGGASSYAPVELSFANITTGGSITATTTGSEYADIALSGLDALHDANRSWTLTNSGMVFTTYSATLNFAAADLDADAAPGIFLVAKKTAGVWSLPTVGTRTAASIQALGLTTMGDFVVGEAVKPITAAAATLASPAIGQAGVNALAEAGAHFTPVSTVWSGRAGAVFAAGEIPKAVITLAPKLGFTFAGLTAATITVEGGVVTYAAGQGVLGGGTSVVFTVTYPQLVAGTALSLGGTDAYVTFGPAPSLAVQNFTIEAWFKRTGPGVAGSTGSGGIRMIPILAKASSENDGSTVDGNYGLGIDVDNNTIAVDFEEGTGSASPGLNHPMSGATVIQNNVWYHAAATFSSTGEYRLYLNGSLERSMSLGTSVWPQGLSIQHSALGTLLNSQGAHIGALAGVIDEARVWNYARTQAQIQSTINSKTAIAQSGLIARWALDEGAGTAVNGSAGTSVNGTIIGSGYEWVEGAPFNLETFPITPALVSPADGGSVSATPTLTVAVRDNSSATLTVKFMGRVADNGTAFDVIGMPDTQYYSAGTNGGTQAMFLSQTQWIRTNASKLNIRDVVSVGDIVDNGADMAQWSKANTAYSILEPPLSHYPSGIPYGPCVGNHDQIGGTANYNATFGVSRFEGRPYYGGHYGSDNNNHYDVFSWGGLEFMTVFLENEPTTEEIAWADGVIAANPTKRAMLISHNILDNATPPPFTPSGQVIFNAVKDNANLFLMLCGHSSGSKVRADTTNGHIIYSMLADYQEGGNGGNGYLRIMNFVPSQNKINFKTYSPYLSSYLTDIDDEFTLPYDMGGTGSAPFAELATVSVPNNSNATFVWNAVESRKTYEWYAIVTNAAGKSMQSPTWSFAKAPAMLSSIAITHPATKLVYKVNDPLDLTGLVVRGTYSDGTTENLSIVPDNVTGFNTASPVPGQVLTITVEGLTATYTITIIPQSTRLTLKVLLQGPYNGTAMSTTLGAGGLLPLSQPFSGAPYVYHGSEAAANSGIFTGNSVSDWVLIELRSSATGAAIDRHAGLLKSDGTVIGADGTPGVIFTATPSGEYYIVVRHRNHLAIMSAEKVALPNAVAYDFSAAQARAYGLNAMASLPGGAFGMIAGDVNGDNICDLSDRTLIWNDNLHQLYAPTDLNFDGISDLSDRTTAWNNNLMQIKF